MNRYLCLCQLLLAAVPNKKRSRRESDLGQKRTSANLLRYVCFALKADIRSIAVDVDFVPTRRLSETADGRVVHIEAPPDRPAGLTLRQPLLRLGLLMF